MDLLTPLRTTPTVFLGEPGDRDRLQVGEKAAALADLARAGFPVPPAFVVTADAFHRCLDAAGVRDEVAELGAAVDPEDEADVLRCSGRLSRLIRAAAMTPTVRFEVLDAYQHLSALVGDHGAPIPVAVRSSVPARGQPASFAGVTSSFTSACGDGDLVRRVVDCWASNVSPRAIAYRASRRAGRADDLAVVVQVMVMSDRSAVACSVDPITGARDRVVVEAARGLGLVIADGTIRPDRYLVDRTLGQVASLVPGRQDHRIAAVRGCSNRRWDLSTERSRPVLQTSEVLTIADTVVRIEQEQGGPQDVELAIDGHGELFVLQSRPVRTPASSDPTPTGPSRSRSTVTTPVDRAASCQGIPASAGRATGAVRVLAATGATAPVRRGEVLVTATASPTWISSLDRAVAVVTDEGGALSNLAVVCREQGVPAVVGTGTATADLTTGAAVEVDADRGLVG